MSLVVPLQGLGPTDVGRAGGKAVALARLAAAGLSVPPGVVVTTAAYRQYMRRTRLGDRVRLELGRKRFEDMRWEELWDAALRIRALFLRTALPPDLCEALAGPLAEVRGPAVVRSSAPAEDSASASFAGLHDSYVGVEGVDALLEHVVKVWASLWSDRALLYRRELGLEPGESAMAVVVQELVVGARSGVVFTQSPTAADEGVIEAVWGLNQGLVDGAVEPDRWHLARDTGAVLRHRAPVREVHLVPGPRGPVPAPLPEAQRSRPPLDEDEARHVFGLARRLEPLVGGPADAEWTHGQGRWWLLQVRPITTASGGDERRWYLSLHQSLAQLRVLRESIEGQSLPAMERAAEDLAAEDLAALDDEELAAAIRARLEVRDHWVEVYWRDFIPFAHGMRLFGKVYADTVRPEDPFEFVDLLRAPLEAGERDAALAALAARLDAEDEPALRPDLEAWVRRWGRGIDLEQELDELGRLLRALARRSPQAAIRRARPDAEAFLARFEGAERVQMEELLDLGRASYRLRDDDNLALGRLEARLSEALERARHRLGSRAHDGASAIQVVHALEDPAAVVGPASASAGGSPLPAGVQIRPRQLVGQPAGPGVARGRARVVREPADLFDFQEGEVLVCDAVEPSLTLVAPLAAAVVERRGGMLIHGAIVAREYGIPCVTGVPGAAERIRTGDRLVVDGDLGLVVVSARAPAP